MLKPHLSWLLASMLLLSTVSQPVVAQQSGTTAQPVDKVITKIARLGVGEKAKATIRLKDGTKIKGYVSQAGKDDFVIRDRKTDVPTTIRYTDVLKVEDNRGHSTARNIGIGIAIGVGAFLAVIGIAIAHLD